MKDIVLHRPVREGVLRGGLPYLAQGSGPPLVVFRGLMPSNTNPTGLLRWAELREFAPLAQRFTVYLVNRRPGLSPTTTMEDLAADHAQALEGEFGGAAVDVLGISTGGSVALQVAVDHPRILRRLVLAGSAYRLRSIAGQSQRRYADLLAQGRSRQAVQELAHDLVRSRLGQGIVGGLLWLLAPLVSPRDPSDMIATIMAEDGFDLGDRLSEIAAPTLIIGGDRDFYYGPELFRQTAERIPNARLLLYQGRSHRGLLLDQRFARDVITFLMDEQI